MKNLDKSICLKLKEARRQAGISQSKLAAEVGCMQSALSMFEQGDGTKLNDEVIERLAAKFSISLVPENTGLSVPALHTPKSAFCPNPNCPTNHVYIVDGCKFLQPHPDECDPVGGRFCAWCGEVLERECPNCGAPIHAGGVCSICGKPYVAT